VIAIASATALFGCSSSASTPTVSDTQEPTVVPTAIIVPTSVPATATRVPSPPTATPTPDPTSTPSPTAVPPTPVPTSTQIPPTSTAIPSPTNTPTPTSTPVPTVAIGQLPSGVVSAFTVSETLDRNPTATPTPFPTAVTPFIEPTPTPTSLGDLQPYFGNGEPLRVRNPNGGAFTEKLDVVVDFFFTNLGSTTVTGDYFIDLYINDVIAQRYNGIDVGPNTFAFIEGGTGILDNFSLQPGEHEVKLDIDPTNLISEVSDGDNTQTTTFVWSGPAIPTPEPDTRLPNLSIVGGSTGIIAAPFEGSTQSGGLSTDGKTFLSFKVLNDSPISISEQFNLNVMYDDVLAYSINYTGLVGGEYINLDWDGLTDTVRVTPGEHTLRLSVDTGGAITESNETDNSIEVSLTWGTGEPITEPVPSPSLGAPIREVQVLPNFTGVTPYGWDASIAASNSTDELSLGSDGNIWAAEDTSISFAIRNSSRVNSAASGAFEAQIFLDNNLLDTAFFESGDDAGSYWTDSITIPANELEPGPHLITLLIDSAGEILESNEQDNWLGRWFEFLPGSPSNDPPAELVFTDAELNAMLAPLISSTFVDQVRATSGSGFDTPDWINEIKEAGRAGYYLLTGRDLDDERIVMHLLPHDQFVAASFNACMTDYFLLPDPSYINTYDSCTDFRGEIGFKYRLNGKVHVYVDLEESPIKALGVYFHELGHALQDLENPDQTDAAYSQNIRGLFEAEAQIFEAAALRAIEEYLGIGLMRFPDVTVVRNEVQFVLDNNKALNGSAEHVLGHNMLWHEVLTNTSGLGFDAELRTNKRLSSASSKALFDYLVSINPTNVDDWVSEIFANSTAADEFIAISLSRLEVDLPVANHGNPTLREPAFIIP